MVRLRRRNNREVSLESLLRLSERADLDGDTDIQNLIQGVSVTNNSQLRKQLQKVLAVRASQHKLYPFNIEKENQSSQIAVQKRIKLGTTASSLYHFQQNNLTRHLLIVGQSGTGKTTVFYNLIRQLGVPFWSFDRKQDYRHLVEDMDLFVLPWKYFRFNPLRPPSGVSPRRWAQVFSEIFGHATALLSGSKNYLMKSIIELYRLYNLFDRVSEPFPSLHELQQLVERERINYVRTTSDYRDRLLNRLEPMNLTAGTVFDCSQGYPVEELLERNVVFEFDGLSRDVQNFLMEILFAYVYEYRLAQNHRGGQLRHVFFLDEGKQVFSVYKERQDAAGIPEIDELTAKMREFGEGLIVADQEASKLTDSIKANTYTKVLLPTGDRKQFKAIAGSMNLSERQMEYAQQLGIGEAVVQVGNRDPIPVRLDDYSLEKTVTDQELRKRMAAKWNELHFEERETTPEFEQAVLQGEPRDEVEIPDDPSELDLSREADRLLKDVVENPFKPLTERYTSFSSRYKGNKAKNELVENGVLIERNIHSKKGRRKLLDITEKGREYIEDELGLETKQGGRGSIVHQYWQHQIREAFEEAGWPAKIEMFDADVYVHMGNMELAVEVAMGNNPREIKHVEKHLDKGFTVWITARNQEILDGLKQRIEESDLQSDRVVFRLVREFNEKELA